jgi:multidrug efflux system outer membrane protein
MTARACAAVALAAVALTGCPLGPDYERPKVTPPASYRFQTEASTAASLADLPWWKVFRDDALRELVDEALKNNYDLQTAAARVESARAQARAAGVQLLPAINGTGTGSYGNSLSGFGVSPAPFWFAGANGSATWEIDVFGRLRRSIESARAQYAATEEARRGVWVTVLAEVAQNYFLLLSLDMQRSIARRTLVSRDSTLTVFRVRAEGGIGTDLDVARGQANVAGARGTLVAVERQIAQNEHLLCLLLGRTPGPIRRAATGGTLPAPPEVPAGLPSALLERRPDVREAEANMIAANAQVGVATANLFPTFSLTTLGGVTSTSLAFAARNTTPQGNYAVSGQTNWLAPVLQGAQLRYLRDAAKNEWLATRAAYFKTVINAFKDVADALVSIATLRDQRAQSEEQVEALTRAVDIAHTQFEGGTATYLDIINAEQQLFPAELELAQVQAQQIVAFVQLYRSLGGGWWLAPGN